jgi:hypothetical protein
MANDKSATKTPTKDKFIVTPIGHSFITFEFRLFLTTFHNTYSEACFKVRTITKNGYYVPHEVLTRIKQERPDWAKFFELYIERGVRRFRTYSIPDKKDKVEMKKAKEFANDAKKKKAERATENSEKS